MGVHMTRGLGDGGGRRRVQQHADRLVAEREASSPAGLWGDSLAYTLHSQSYTCCRGRRMSPLRKRGLLKKAWKQVG